MATQETADRAASAAAPFGALLRRYRRAAGLTHEALAERAGLGARTLSDLERGVSRAPRAATLRRLTDALGLPAEARAVLEAAARPQDGAPPTPAPLPAGPPVPLTGFVGRERELAAAGALLGRARLLTLTGPGGVGKTRLALELAWRAQTAFPDGVAVVSLAPLADPDIVVPAIARGVGARETGGQTAGEALRARLQGRRLLLVLDNCEHLPATGTVVAELLRACSGLAVVATTRAPLGV